MNIPQKIDEIIAKRQEKRPYVAQMQQRLEKVRDAVALLDAACQEASQDFESNTVGTFSSMFRQHPEIAENLRGVSTKRFYEEYDRVQKSLTQLYERFSREQVHISFVGRAGQGKSLLMQRISGLGGDVIPSSDGSDCTGAKSIITNRDMDDVCAEITFYTRDEYRDIVNKYLETIFDSKQYCVHSVEEICRLDTNMLRERLKDCSTTKASMYVQLEKYLEHTAEIQPLLGTVKSVSANEIEYHVAQYNHEDKALKYYTYLGVKVANILCRFPYKQCGKIVLVDTIGLGSTELDVRKKMLDAVSNDSDAILFMFRPEPTRARPGEEDISIITDISTKVTSEYSKELLFWIINRVNSEKSYNADKVPEVIEGIRKLPNVQVADILDVDCMNQQEVEEKALIPVLDRLSGNLPRMDEILLRRAEQQLEKLYQEYHSIAEKAGQAFVKAIDQDVRREFAPQIQESINKMTNAIRDLYMAQPYGVLRGEVCTELKTAAEQKLINILRCVPEESEILALLEQGTINQHNAYEKLTDKIRLRIIDDFLDLNTTLHSLTAEMKRQVVYCMTADSLGQLSKLLPMMDDDPQKWLVELESILKEYPKYQPIWQAVEKLVDFELRMESFLIYRVRAHLDNIDHSLLQELPTIRGNLAEKNVIANDIRFWMEHNMEIVYKEIRDELEPLYSYPNSTLWAVVKDFYDRVVYARQGNLEVQEAWRYLYEDNIACIWPERYRDYQQEKGVSAQWNELVGTIHKYDNKAAFSFEYRG